MTNFLYSLLGTLLAVLALEAVYFVWARRKDRKRPRPPTPPEGQGDPEFQATRRAVGEDGDIIDMKSLAAFGSVPDGERIDETLDKIDDFL